jgi:hypothetical protein
VLHWARENGCPWDDGTTRGAAVGGHFAILQWVCANGCPVTMQTCSYAVRFGHLEILQWLRAVGCPWDWRDCEIWAMASNQVDMLAWLRENKAG